MNIDTDILLFVNQHHTLFLDNLMLTFTSVSVWFPLYIALGYNIIKNNVNMSSIGKIFACLLVCFFFSELMVDFIAKPYFQRLRPCFNPTIRSQLHVVIDNVSQYGFFSGHASNTFSLAVLYSMIFKNKWLKVTLFFWVFINCFSRIYLGLHYPSDILFGLLWGWLDASIIFHVYKKLSTDEKKNNVYKLVDINIVPNIFFLTCNFSIIFSLFR